MTTHDPKSFRPLKHENRFIWMVEQERLRNNIQTLQQISEKLDAQREEFSQLFTEMQSTRAETRSLQILLNKTALSLGLEPIAPTKNGQECLTAPLISP